MNAVLVVVVLILSGLSFLLAEGISDHEITALPGWFPKQLPSRQFSGFVDADTKDYLKMHYWFVEAENSPETAPLVLWFNGGPGASSLYGLLVELGPFLLSDLSLSGPEYEETGIPQLIYNPYGWQKVANILAFSIPPPVGFSFCNPPGASAVGTDCGAWNDTSTAEVTYHAINSWLKLFPQYKTNEMFLLGESYAGVYVPSIVKQILAHPDSGINLVGFGVGDACTPPEICGSKHYGPYFEIQFLYGKAAFSNQLYEQIMSTCTTDELINGNMSEDCTNVVARMDEEVGGYWVYGYYDTCWYENDIRRRRGRRRLSSRAAAIESSGDADADGSPRRQQPYYGPPIIPVGGISSTGAVGITPNENKFVGGNGYACGGPNAQVLYLDRPEVKRALNLPEDAQFFQCDNGENFVYEETETDLISWYKDIIAEGKLRVMVYNGDTDPCINTFQAQNWTRNLGFQETQSWRPWTLDGCQNMGGYVTRYENNFDFVSIKGSGHMVPLHRPQATLEFISKFLHGEDYYTYNPECTFPSSFDEKNEIFTKDYSLGTSDDSRKQQIIDEIAAVNDIHRRKLANLHKQLLDIEII